MRLGRHSRRSYAVTRASKLRVPLIVNVGLHGEALSEHDTGST